MQKATIQRNIDEQFQAHAVEISQIVSFLPEVQCTEKNVLKPLDMKASTFKQPLPKELQSKATAGHDLDGNVIDGKWHAYPEKGAAGLWTTPTDLAKFLIAMLKISEGSTDYPINKKI